MGAAAMVIKMVVVVSYTSCELSTRLDSVFLFLKKKCIYFWLSWVFVAVWRSLVSASRDYCTVALCRLLTAGASLLAWHGLSGTGLQ